MGFWFPCQCKVTQSCLVATTKLNRHSFPTSRRNLCLPIKMLPGPRSLRPHHYRNDFRKSTKLSDLQQKESQGIIEESNRLVDEVHFTTEEHKREVDRRLNERLKDITFLRDELQVKKRDALKEEEALEVFRQRLEKSISAIEALQTISMEVQDIRKQNPYAKGTVDVADRAVTNELRVFKEALQELCNSLENLNELTRKLRESIFNLDKDIKFKDDVKDVEELCCGMKETILTMRLIEGDFKREGISMDEWNKLSFNRIQSTRNLIQQGTSLRSFVAVQLKEIVERLRDQFHRTNEKFNERIAEMKETKSRLENTLKTNLDHMNTIERNLVNLDKELLAKHGFINVCTTRLNTRSQRRGQELCEDGVTHALLKELANLKSSVIALKAQIETTNFSGKHLQAAALQLKEKLQQETYLIQLNEVDCMTRRANLQLQWL